MKFEAALYKARLAKAPEKLKIERKKAEQDAKELKKSIQKKRGQKPKSCSEDGPKELKTSVPKKRDRKPKLTAVPPVFSDSETYESEDDPLPLLSEDSDLEEKEEYTPNLQFGVADFVVVKFTMEETRTVKDYTGKILEVNGEA